MSVLHFKGFTVSNVESCPRCKNFNLSVIQESPQKFKVCCRCCLMKSDEYLIIENRIHIEKEKKLFVETTRKLLNIWNHHSAKYLNKGYSKIVFIY